MQRTMKIITLMACLTSYSVLAHETSPRVGTEVIATSPLANVPGNSLSAVVVDLPPGISVPAHTHAGFVFVYVLEGTVRSQLNSDESREFATGESWVEPPGTVHSLTQNPSATDKAKILAVFVAEDGAELTKMGAPTH